MAIEESEERPRRCAVSRCGEDDCHTRYLVTVRGHIANSLMNTTAAVTAVGSCEWPLIILLEALYRHSSPKRHFFVLTEGLSQHTNKQSRPFRDSAY